MSHFMQKMPGQMYNQTGTDESMDVRHQQNKIYGNQQDKYTNGRDRMNMGAQPTPPPQNAYGQPGGYGGNQQMNSVLNSKKFHGQWAN